MLDIRSYHLCIFSGDNIVTFSNERKEQQSNISNTIPIPIPYGNDGTGIHLGATPDFNQVYLLNFQTIINTI